MVKYILVCGGVISYVKLFSIEDDKLIMSSGIGKGVIGEYPLALRRSGRYQGLTSCSIQYWAVTQDHRFESHSYQD